MAAMRAFGTHLSSSVEEGGKKFRFVYLSGGMSERDQSRSLWMAGETRKIRVFPLSFIDYSYEIFWVFLWVSLG